MDVERFNKVLTKHKDLTANGFDTDLMRLLHYKRTGTKPPSKVPPTIEGTEVCVEWLLEHDAFDRRKTINFACSSYGFKHVVEKAKDQYVSNGEFICAALYLGYEMKRLHKHTPNAYFNIRSIKAEKQ